MSAFFGQQNRFSIKLQLVVTFREIVTVYDVTAGVRGRHRHRGLVLVHAAPRCLEAARSLTPFSAKRPMQRDNFFSRGHCTSLSNCFYSGRTTKGKSAAFFARGSRMQMLGKRLLSARFRPPSFTFLADLLVLGGKSF